VRAVVEGSFLRKQPPQIAGTGFVVQSLEAALWAFAHATDFASGALLAVNLGDDADTTGAVYGQIAGAHFGLEGIPAHWRARLQGRDEMLALADRLLAASGLASKVLQ
jgi:ADP-ribosyl-[dinitrogen reductase] hydrolase